MRRALALLALLPLLGATCYRPEPTKAGFAIGMSGRTTTEAGGSVTMDVALTAAPASPVPVVVATSNVAEGAILDPASGRPAASVTLQFSPADWDRPQRVTLVGVDDTARDGDVTWWAYVVVGDTSDAEYAALDATWIGLVNVDDDTPRILVSGRPLRTQELPGSTDSFSVALAARPAGVVTIPVASGLPDEGLLRSSTTPNVSDRSISLVFTPSDWATPREVIVAGQVDHLLDGDQTYSVTVGPATGDPEYAKLPAQTVTVTNRDVDGLAVACDGWTGVPGIWEGQSLTFSCVLRGAPTADVAIPFTSGDPTEALLSVGGAPTSNLTLVFTPQNWYAPQVVTVHGVLDRVWEPWAAAPTAITGGPLSTTDEAYSVLGWSSSFYLYVYDVDTAPPPPPPPPPPLPPP